MLIRASSNHIWHFFITRLIRYRLEYYLILLDSLLYLTTSWQHTKVLRRSIRRRNSNYSSKLVCLWGSNKSILPNYTNFKIYDKAVESMQNVDIVNWTQVAVHEIIAASGKYTSIYVHNIWYNIYLHKINFLFH